MRWAKQSVTGGEIPARGRFTGATSTIHPSILADQRHSESEASPCHKHYRLGWHEEEHAARMPDKGGQPGPFQTYLPTNEHGFSNTHLPPYLPSHDSSDLQALRLLLPPRVASAVKAQRFAWGTHTIAPSHSHHTNPSYSNPASSLEFRPPRSPPPQGQRTWTPTGPQQEGGIIENLRLGYAVKETVCVGKVLSGRYGNSRKMLHSRAVGSVAKKSAWGKESKSASRILNRIEVANLEGGRWDEGHWLYRRTPLSFFSDSVCRSQARRKRKRNTLVYDWMVVSPGSKPPCP